MKTKERILEEALTLFSVQGFRGTSVKNIADAVGIKDSSLYKHFRSKREIFNQIVQEMRDRMERLSEAVGLPDGDGSAATDFYGGLSLLQLRELSRRILLFYLEDDFISRFWRMANMEQYQDPEIYAIYRRIFMEESISYQTGLFGAMIERDIFIPTDPEVMAMNFYAPIFFLLSKYSGRPTETEMALDALDRQVQEFYRIYRRLDPPNGQL